MQSIINWSTHVNNTCIKVKAMSKILNNLDLISFKERRKQNRLILFYKGLRGWARIPLHDLTVLLRKTKNMNQEP